MFSIAYNGPALALANASPIKVQAMTTQNGFPFDTKKLVMLKRSGSAKFAKIQIGSVTNPIIPKPSMLCFVASTVVYF